MAQRNDETELHLRDSEGRSNRYLATTAKRYRSNDAATKLEAVAWAKRVSINSAHKKFGVDRKCIKDWIAKEENLKR